MRRLLRWMAMVFAVGAFLALTAAPLSAQTNRRAQWVVTPADGAPLDSLRVAAERLGGAFAEPDRGFYLLGGPWAALRDSIFAPADPNRIAKAGARVAATGPWKRYLSFVELDAIVDVPNDSAATGDAALAVSNWAATFTGAEKVWAMGIRGGGTKVAGADTGIDQYHPEFAGRFLYGRNLAVASLGGAPVDSMDFADTIGGCNGHGTHTTSSLGGATKGMAPDALVVHYRVFDASGSGCVAYASSTTRAILRATADLVDVLNVSIGHTASASMGNAVTAFRNAGGVVCGANGNDGANGAFAPALYDDAIGSAAVDASGARASWSRVGSTTDFGSPGVGVPGAMPGGGFADKSGTSMASPITCGLVDLVLSMPGMASMPRTRARIDSAQALLCTWAERRPPGGHDNFTGCGTPNVARVAAALAGGMAVAAQRIDTIAPTTAPVRVCKPVVEVQSWTATANVPWLQVTTPTDSLCYRIDPALVPSGSETLRGVITYRAGNAPPPPPPVTGPTVAIDLGTHFQTMDMWETSLRMWEQDKINDRYAASVEGYATAVANFLVDSVGINGVRVQVQSGLENPVDYWSQFVSGALSYNVWGPSRYEKVNDNANPNVANLAGFQFSAFDYQMERFVLPMKARLAARGESLHVNLNYLDFKWNAARQGTLSHATNPAEFAEYVLVFFERMRDRYGITPDAFEVILEPENTLQWDGGAIGRGAVAVAARLAAAGFHPKFIVPSMTNMGNAVPTFNAVMAVPGTAGVISMLAYHRYGGESEANAVTIRTTAAARGVKTAMLEKVGAGIDELMEDLTVANASAWQQWGMADESGHDDAGAYYARVVVGQPAATAISMASRTKLLAPVFRAVRRGAVRVGSTATELKTAAFVNPDGRVVVVLRPRGAGSTTVVGLPVGQYAVTFTPESGSSTTYTAPSNGALPVAMPGAGLVTIRGVP